MPPHSEEAAYLGTAGFKPVSGLTVKNKGGHVWLDGKRKDDGAEGLWRIHDNLYDLTNFVKRHPGGSEWLEMTKGTDITEAFETHHLHGVAETILPKYLLKEAATPRVSPFTFEEDGFYKTLKRRVAPLVKTLPKSTIKLSALYTDLLLVGIFIASIAACRYWSFALAALGGFFLACVTVAAHNYFHQKDNLRMYYFAFSLMNYREWRISHVLSHHLYTNTIVDLEMLTFQPYIEYFPKSKSVWVKYMSWLYAPLLWSLLFHLSLVLRVVSYAKTKDDRIFDKSDLIPYILPASMYLLGGQSVLATVVMWTVVVVCGSLTFAFVGLNAAHHHPDIFHDGDTPRKEKDWGIMQLDAVMDRKEITGSHYLVLTNFGDHGLHHMFPTLDQGLLETFYPIFRETMKEFGVDLRMSGQAELIKGQFLQMSRSEPNPNPPDLFKYARSK